VAGTTAIKKDRFETDSGDGDFLNFCRPKMGRVSQSIASESPGVRGLQASRFHARRGDRPERVEPPVPG
jgi:hypothetical protein